MKKNTGKIIAGVLLLAGGYFIYKYFSKPKISKAEPASDPILNTSTSNTTSKPKPVSSGFPLKKGSRGAKVKELQQAILKYDPKALPKYGADSDFGSETQFAVSKILGKTSVDSQADIDKIIAMYNKREFPYITPNEPPAGGLPALKFF
jgi:hypothetical protein